MPVVHLPLCFLLFPGVAHELVNTTGQRAVVLQDRRLDTTVQRCLRVSAAALGLDVHLRRRPTRLRRGIRRFVSTSGHQVPALVDVIDGNRWHTIRGSTMRHGRTAHVLGWTGKRALLPTGDQRQRGFEFARVAAVWRPRG